jgi:hypothetical protein
MPTHVSVGGVGQGAYGASRSKLGEVADDVPGPGLGRDLFSHATLGPCDQTTPQRPAEPRLSMAGRLLLLTLAP